MIGLRPYQTEAKAAAMAYWADGGGNPLIDLATGTGKSLLNASMIKDLIQAYGDMRIGCITHVKELIEQNAAEMLRLWPGAPIGIYSAGVGRKDVGSQVLFGGIQSIYRKAAALGRFDLLIVDEAHLIPRNADTMYGRFITDCREAAPDMRILGLTATPYRLDTGRLDEGEDRIFDKIVYSYGIAQGIEDGYLSPLISKRGAGEIDVSKVRIKGGEFDERSLQTAANDIDIIREACGEIAAYMREQGRNCALAFCTGVDHARTVADVLCGLGVKTAAISGDDAPSERARLMSALKSGELECLTNVGIMTTGTNIPRCNLIAMLRPTLSTGLYIQILGRGTRIVADVSRLETAEARREAIARSPKPDCLILDFAGNVRRHGPVDDVHGTSAGGAKRVGEAPEKVKVATIQGKECGECRRLVALAVTTCPECGWQWPVDAAHFGRADAENSVLKREAPVEPPEYHPVLDWFWYPHEKPGKPRSLRIEYTVAGRPFPIREWLCFEHTGFPRAKAEQIWMALTGDDMEPPSNVAEALERIDEAHMPEAILVRRKDDKFEEIVSRQMKRPEQQICMKEFLADEIPF